MFALQHGGQCFSAWDAGSTYTRYGRSIDCGSDGEGGGWANQVYKMLKFGEFRCLFSSLILIHVTICFFNLLILCNGIRSTYSQPLLTIYKLNVL